MGLLGKFKKLILVLVTVALLLFAGWMFGRQKQSGVSINTNRASVIQEMKSLQRLETASFTIEKIIDGGTSGNNAFQKFLFGDRILLIAHGQVIAGFDFSQISEKDIEVNGDSVRLKMPKAQILVTTLDNNQTKVYDRQKGILNPGIKDLESLARAQAEKSIKQAACDGGILIQASDNGRKQITALLSALGFEQISIEIPQGACEI
jgi:hypothetical protein